MTTTISDMDGHVIKWQLSLSDFSRSFFLSPSILLPPPLIALTIHSISILVPALSFAPRVSDVLTSSIDIHILTPHYGVPSYNIVWVTRMTLILECTTVTYFQIFDTIFTSGTTPGRGMSIKTRFHPLLRSSKAHAVHSIHFKIWSRE